MTVVSPFIFDKVRRDGEGCDDERVGFDFYVQGGALPGSRVVDVFARPIKKSELCLGVSCTVI